MKILAINTLPFGSTGNIMRGILEVAESEMSAECYSFYGNWKGCPSNYRGSVRFGFRLENYESLFLSKYLGLPDYGSVLGTLSLLRRIDQIKPDIIHLHNLHLSTINSVLLFKYIKKHDIPVVWTLHDCWSFTGRCPHFMSLSCDKWKTGCKKCQYPKSRYPYTNIDYTSRLWRKKNHMVSEIGHMTIVTPSEWLGKAVRQSFMNRFPVAIINNGIDLDVFKPRISDVREKILSGKTKKKYIVLGVSFSWGYYKGLDVFEKLVELLDDAFQIVLVGTNADICRNISDKIICIDRTYDQKELAEIYSAADIFVNPTREENFPTVNIEALACGTPVVSFDTGGCAEIVDNTCGKIVSVNEINQMVSEINNIVSNHTVSSLNCRNRAERYENRAKFREYLNIYKMLVDNEK